MLNLLGLKRGQVGRCYRRLIEVLLFLLPAFLIFYAGPYKSRFAWLSIGLFLLQLFAHLVCADLLFELMGVKKCFEGTLGAVLTTLAMFVGTQFLVMVLSLLLRLGVKAILFWTIFSTLCEGLCQITLLVLDEFFAAKGGKSDENA